MDKKEFLAWETTASDTIDFKKVYVDMADDLVAGLMLAQIVYYHLPARNGRASKMCVTKEGYFWIAKAHKDWYEECRITEWQSSRALKILEERGIVMVKQFKFDGIRMNHIRLDWDTFLKSLEKHTSDNYDSAESETSSLPVPVQAKDQDGYEQKTSIGTSESLVPLTESTTETTAQSTTKNKNTRPDRSQGFSEDQNQPEDENREPDKFDLMTKEELRKLFEPYGGEEPPPELTVEEENQKLTEMGIVGDNPFGLDEMSPEEYFQALPKIRERLRSEGINAPVDWVIATSRERGADHIREENERRQELKRQGRDLELEQAVANVRSWMPPETVELAVVFVEKTRMTPVVSDRRAWMKAFSDMHKKGVIPKDLKSGIGRMKEKGLMIKSPFSVATSAVNQMGIRKVEEDRYKIG